MFSPRITEVPQAIEAVTPDPFITDLDKPHVSTRTRESTAGREHAFATRQASAEPPTLCTRGAHASSDAPHRFVVPVVHEIWPVHGAAPRTPTRKADMIPSIHLAFAQERMRQRLADGRRRRTAAACQAAARTPAEVPEDQRRRVEASLLRTRRGDRTADRRRGEAR